LPQAVVSRAEEVLRALEEGREGHKPLARIDDLPLFSVAPPDAPQRNQTNAVEEKLAAISPDSLTPKAALELLYELKSLLADH
jgi:DNA mismatch repair protein MutS